MQPPSLQMIRRHQMLGPPLERVCDTNPTKNNIVSTVRMEVQKMLLVLQLNWPKKVIGYWQKKGYWPKKLLVQSEFSRLLVPTFYLCIIGTKKGKYQSD
jgi:hypothetical protein